MAATRTWSDLSRGQRAAIVAGAAVEVVLTCVAIVDLVPRPGSQVRGPKALWLLGCAVQPFGPLAYLTAGRRCRRCR